MDFKIKEKLFDYRRPELGTSLRVIKDNQTISKWMTAYGTTES